MTRTVIPEAGVRLSGIHSVTVARVKTVPE